MADKDPGIRTYYEPKGKELEMLKFINDRKIAMESSDERQKAVEAWKRGRKQWEALREEKGEDDWQSNHYVPVTTAVVETALSEIIDQSPKPLILPRGREDTPRANIMQHTFEYTWEVADSDVELYNVWKDTLIEGTAIAQEYYFRDVRKVKTPKKDGKKGEYEEKEVFDYDDVYLESIKNDDFYVDENARSFSGPYGARDCIRRVIMHIDDFKSFFSGKTWDPLGNASKVQAGGDTNYYEWYKPSHGVDTKDMVEVWWYWQVKPGDWLCVVANEVMVVMGPNPYKHKQLPFARAVDVKRTHKFYGKGQPELLESIQDETNVMRRMTIDRSHLDIDKMFFVSNRLNLSDEDTIARPHGTIPVDDVDGAKAVEYGDTPRSVEMTLKHLDDDGTIVTGINPRAQALPTSGTATEAAILKESTLKRIRLKVRLFEKEFLVRVGRLRVANIMQYYSQPKLEKIVGNAATAEFKQEIEKLKQEGLVETVGDENFKKVYRQIRIKDRQIDFDTEGQMTEKPMEGVSFFDLKPEYFMPVASGGYDIKFAAGSTLPISKPLMQSKTAEMFDRVLTLMQAFPQVPIYDPKKLGDSLLKVNDFNPSDFKVDQPPQDEGEQRVTQSLEIANVENKLMMEGQSIPATGYAPVPHTQVHLAFMQSPTFQGLQSSDPRVQVFMEHVTGEIASIAQRQGMVGAGEQGGMPQGGPLVGGESGGNKALRDTIPALIQGGGQAPSAV